MRMQKQSKFLALILRHNPAAGNLSLDREGWANVNEVMAALRVKFGPFTRAELQELVDTNDKRRYAFNERGDKIRANQGHSIEVDLNLVSMTPPDYLYHGTKQAFLGSILRDGLKPGQRQHVHLSRDLDTAETVANRRAGKNVILLVHAGDMVGHSFYLSENGVWLTGHVPPEFLEITGDWS
jgi:putative RNA 2'-phosphotransferase